MGLLHNFSGLQQHGIKLCKFKQAVMIDTLAERKRIPETMMHVTVGGACASYCLIWLYLRFNNGRLRQLNRSHGVRVDDLNLEVANLGVMMQDKLVKDSRPEEWVERNEERFAAFGLNFQVDPEAKVGFAPLLGGAASLLLHRPGVYVSMDQVGSNSHAIAMFRSENAETFFFDPDIGEYRITEVKEFLTAYLRLRNAVFLKKVTGGHIAAISAK